MKEPRTYFGKQFVLLAKLDICWCMKRIIELNFLSNTTKFMEKMAFCKAYCCSFLGEFGKIIKEKLFCLKLNKSSSSDYSYKSMKLPKRKSEHEVNGQK